MAEREARVALWVLPEPVVKEEEVARPMEETQAMVAMVGTRQVETAVMEAMVALPREERVLLVLLLLPQRDRLALPVLLVPPAPEALLVVPMAPPEPLDLAGYQCPESQALLEPWVRRVPDE